MVFDERFHKDSIGRLLHERKQLSGDSWVIGEIIAIGEQEMTILGPDNKEVQSVWSEDVLLPFGGSFEVGQKIRLIGEWQDDVFVAKGLSEGKMQWRGMRRGSPQVRGRMAPPLRKGRY